MPQPNTRPDIFTRHVLSGFTPVVPHIRYPVTVGLYQEGPNLGLFLAPADLALIRGLTHLPDNDQALVLRGSAVLDGAFMQAEPHMQLMPWSDVDHLSADFDVVHIPSDVSVELGEMEIPTPVLAAPDQAVPQHLKSRVAIGFGDGCHAAVISPDSKLISRCLTGFISAYTSSAAKRACPALPSELVDTFMAPMPPGNWSELRIIPSHRFFALEIASNGQNTDTTRWICKGPGHIWRRGWSW